MTEREKKLLHDAATQFLETLESGLGVRALIVAVDQSGVDQQLITNLPAAAVEQLTMALASRRDPNTSIQ